MISHRPFAFFLAVFSLSRPGRSRGRGPGPGKPASLSSPRFDVLMASVPIQVDGVLDEECWAAAPAIPLPFEWQPGDNILPRQDGMPRDLQSPQPLYCLPVLDPEPKKIRGHLMDRDDTDTLILDDHVSFMIDAFNDERRAFQFGSIPWGSKPTPYSASSRDTRISPGTRSGPRPPRSPTGAGRSRWPSLSASSGSTPPKAPRPGASRPSDPGPGTPGTA